MAESNHDIQIRASFIDEFTKPFKGVVETAERGAKAIEDVSGKISSSMRGQFQKLMDINYAKMGPRLPVKEMFHPDPADVAAANASHITGSTGSASAMLLTDQTRSAEKFKESLEGISKAFAKCTSAAAAFAKMTPFPAMLQSLKNLSKPLKDFGRVFKRILLYKTIRGGIGAIIRGWREGLQNLYHYSQTFGTQFHNTMDSLATDAQMLKNGFAAMVAPLINAVGPVISAIAQRIVDLANAIGYFFAKILGQGSFSAAIRGSATAFKEMGGAAKEAKKQLMGFDELNVLTLPSSGGGGAGADYGKMFEEWDTALEEGSIEARLREAIENADWEGVGSLMAEKLNGLVDTFGEGSFGEKLGQKLRNGLNVAHGFMMRFNFTNAGASLASNINKMLTNIKGEDGLGFKNLGETLATGVTGVFDFLAGFITELDTSELASDIGDVVKGWFNHFTEWFTDGHIKWDEFGETFFQKVYDFVTGIDFAGIADSFFTALGTAINAAWHVLEGFLSGMWDKWKEYCGIEADDSGTDLVGKFLTGIWNAMVDIATWVYEHVVKPFFDALRGKKGFGVDEEGGETEETGKDVIKSFLDGLTVSWEDVKTWVTNKVTWFKNQLKGMKDWLLDGMNGKGTYKWTPSMEAQSLKYKMAEGGTVPTGQLFIANEAGPELVGSVGGKTTVTSQDQFTAGMADIMDVTNTVILQAAQSLMQTIQNKNMTAVAVIGDREVVQSYDRGKTLAGGSLVE